MLRGGGLSTRKNYKSAKLCGLISQHWTLFFVSVILYFCLPGQLEKASFLCTGASQKYKLLLNSFCNLLRHSTTKGIFFVKLYLDMFVNLSPQETHSNISLFVTLLRLKFVCFCQKSFSREMQLCILMLLACKAYCTAVPHVNCFNFDFVHKRKESHKLFP